MFLVNAFIVISVVYWISAFIAETVLTSGDERSLHPGVRVGFGFLISLIYFSSVCLLMSVQLAWMLGIILLSIYIYGVHGIPHKPKKEIMSHFITQYGKTFIAFFAGTSIFFLPLIMSNNYGPFTEGGGDVSIYSDTAKYLQDNHLNQLGLTSNSLADLERNIKEIFLPKSLTERALLFDKQLMNPPSAEYANYRIVMKRTMNYFNYIPYQIYGFLGSFTNYAVYYGIQAFTYFCLLSGVWCFFRQFGMKVAGLAILIIGTSYGLLSVFYNMFSMQAICLALSSLVIAALPLVRMRGWAGFRTFGCAVLYVWLIYIHYLSVLLPIILSVFLTQRECGRNPSIHKKRTSIFTIISTIIFLTIVALAIWVGSHWSLTFIKLLISGAFDEKAHTYLNDSLPIFSLQWLSFTFGFLSQQHFQPFAAEYAVVNYIVSVGVTIGFIALLVGGILIAKVISSKVILNSKKKFYTTLYVTSILVVLIQLYLGHSSLYFQAKGAQNVLICLYLILLVPLALGSLASQEGLKIQFYMVFLSIALLLFLSTLFVARAVYTTKLGFTKDRSTILESSYFAEAKKIISADANAFVLFEPRKSADLYVGVQPFFKNRMVPTRSLAIQKELYNVDGWKKYLVLASDLIELNDLPHLWTLNSVCKEKSSMLHTYQCQWKAEKLLEQRIPKLLLFADDYERNFGQKQLIKNDIVPMTVSYLRNGTAMLFVPQNVGGNLEVIMQPRDEIQYVKMLQEITTRLKNGEFGKNVALTSDGLNIKLAYKLAVMHSSMLKLIAHSDKEYWLNVKLDNNEIN